MLTSILHQPMVDFSTHLELKSDLSTQPKQRAGAGGWDGWPRRAGACVVIGCRRVERLEAIQSINPVLITSHKCTPPQLRGSAAGRGHVDGRPPRVHRRARGLRGAEPRAAALPRARGAVGKMGWEMGSMTCIGSWGGGWICRGLRPMSLSTQAGVGQARRASPAGGGCGVGRGRALLRGLPLRAARSPEQRVEAGWR